ncbi:MAG TPA: hypothetical protein VGR98_28020 [Streptosporangiaceae bacterium]|nr:hypothetical protein [Streptosporangiaceae bacterium]
MRRWILPRCAHCEGGALAMAGRPRCDCDNVTHMPLNEAIRQQMMADLVHAGWKPWQVADLAYRLHSELDELADLGFPARDPARRYSPLMRET